MFTARYGLNPYITHIRFVCESLNGLVPFRLVSARVPSHFNWSPTYSYRTLNEHRPGPARVCNVAGAHYGPFIRSWGTKDRAVNLGQCFGCINPEFFAPGYQNRMSHLMQYLRNMDPVSTEHLVPLESQMLLYVPHAATLRPVPIVSSQLTLIMCIFCATILYT